MTALPYGLRDVKIYPIVAGVIGTGIDLPNSRTLSFEEGEEFEELRGDDKVAAIVGKGPGVDWELESGGLALEALVILNGGTLLTAGTGATLVKTYTKKDTDRKPDFAAIGQSISEAGGDVKTLLFRCKSSDGVSGEFADGAFFLTSASGRAIGRDSDGTIYKFVDSATAAAIETDGLEAFDPTPIP